MKKKKKFCYLKKHIENLTLALSLYSRTEYAAESSSYWKTIIYTCSKLTIETLEQGVKYVQS